LPPKFFDLQIIPLSEGRFTVDATKQFIPFNETDVLTDRPRGSLLVEIQPFVVVTHSEVILLDTGLGFTDAQGNLTLHQHLINAGINPLDITHVLMSHLHKDHAGGISKPLPFSDQRVLSFPNATYVINKQEFEWALQRKTSSYVAATIEPLIDSDRLLLVEGTGKLNNLDSGIASQISYACTGGHCKWHQVFWIEEHGKIAFFGGDVAPQLAQLKNRFVAKYDEDGKLAAALRAEWWEKGNALGWKFLFYHDIKTPVTPA
jgi:glyoxylase-like metal-dependent hydrolase (beta-lactamase superfamily II)